MSRPPLQIGMVGLPASAPDPLLDVINESSRLVISHVYSPIFASCQAYARRMQLAPCGSLRKLARSHIIEGLIWNRQFESIETANWLTATGAKPVLIRRAVLESLTTNQLEHLTKVGQQSNAAFFPELPHRWTPTTLRVRELIATQLGPIKSIHVKLNQSWENGWTCFTLIDWLRQLIPLAVSTEAVQIRNGYILLHESTPSRPNVTCTIQPQQANPSCTAQPWSAKIDCNAGTIEIHSDVELTWTRDSHLTTESLHSDRPASEVTVDLFGRRLAQGLVPLPSLGELLSSRQLAEFALNLINRSSNE